MQELHDALTDALEATCHFMKVMERGKKTTKTQALASLVLAAAWAKLISVEMKMEAAENETNSSDIPIPQGESPATPASPE